MAHEQGRVTNSCPIQARNGF